MSIVLQLKFVEWASS